MGSHPNSITSSRASRRVGHLDTVAVLYPFGAQAKGVAWPRRSAVDEIPPSKTRGDWRKAVLY